MQAHTLPAGPIDTIKPRRSSKLEPFQKHLVVLSFREADLNEAASAADASRDTIWQGNCDVADLQLRSNIAPIRNTIPIQYPISNCPAKPGGFLQVAVSKARRAEYLLFRNFAQSARFRYSTKTFQAQSILCAQHP